MLSFFANLFGYLLNFLYNIVSNYGIAIILFSVLVKLVMLPLTIKQQKTLKKNEKMQKEMQQIQFKYKNDQEKMQQELMALYKREGMSPLSGCFSSIIQFILLFSVFLLVREPLTYMVKLDSGVIEKLESIVSEQGQTNNTYSEIAVIQYMRNPESRSSVSNDENEQKQDEDTNQVENEQSTEKNEDFNIDEYKEQVNLKMDFFGIDLSQVPTKDIRNWKSLVIPVLYVISSFISIRLTTNMTKKKKEENKSDSNSEEEYNPMEDANKTMMWVIPIMSVSIAVIAPLGLALYWLANNVLMLVERLVLNKIFDKEEEAKENA